MTVRPWLSTPDGIAVADHPIVTRGFRDELDVLVELGDRVAWGAALERLASSVCRDQLAAGHRPTWWYL